MDSDTLDDVPDHALNPMFIEKLMFSQLSGFVGPVFSGLASPAFASSDVHWGREMQLGATETLQMRIFPRGVVSSGHLIDMKHLIVLIAARRRSHDLSKDFVSLAILWHPDQDVDLRFSAFDSLKQTSQSVAARNLHIVLPSLFNHHDARYASTAGKRREAIYPVTDEYNFHAVRPSTFTVHRPIRMQNGQTIMTATASPGISQFIIGGHLANAEVEDLLHRSTEPLPYAKWMGMVQNYTEGLQQKCGFQGGLVAMHNAMAVTDLLTCEGLLGILGHSFSGGSMPDMLHSPGGFPLLIAMACRIACYPERFQLVAGTDADRFANREFVSMFESNWQAMSPTQAGGRNVYAIDLALSRGIKEARLHASKEGTSQAVEDHLTLWHRAGQRCLTAVLGPQLEDFLPWRSTVGKTTPKKLLDPLLEARNRVMREQISATEAVTGNDSRQTVHMASTQEKINILMMVMNSVEHWLRSGQYCGMQIHKRNEVSMRIKRGSDMKMMKKPELIAALKAGMEQSVKEMIKDGEAETENKAREAAGSLHDGILSALQADDDDTEIDFNALKLKLPHSIARDIGIEVDTHEQEDNAYDLDKENICFDAFKGAISCISAAMCQGPMVRAQMPLCQSPG